MLSKRKLYYRSSCWCLFEMESADVSAETIPAMFHLSKSFLSAENRSQKFSPAWHALTNTHMNARILFLQTKAKLLPPPLDLGTFGSDLQVSMGLRPHRCFFCIQNSDFSTRIASLYGSQPSSVVLCIHNSVIMTRINSLYCSQTSPFVLCLQNSVISTRITSLHGFQASPVVLCMQNNVISIRITSLYWS